MARVGAVLHPMLPTRRIHPFSRPTRSPHFYAKQVAMPNHARPKLNPLLRAAATVTVAAAAVALAASGSASASPVQGLPDSALGSGSPLGSSLGPELALGPALGPALAPVKNLPINPLAKTGVDPLDNVVTPQVADFKPMSTGALTGPLSQGDSLSELPLVGQATRLLPG